MRIAQLTIVAMFLWLLTSASVSQTREVEDLKGELEETRQRAESLLQTQADLYDQLAALDHELELSSRLLRQLRSQIRKLTDEVEATNDTLAALQGSSLEANQQARERLRRYYVLNSIMPPLAPLAPIGGLDLSDNTVYYRRLVAHDNLRISSLSMEINSREELLNSLEDRKTELQHAVAQRRSEEANMKETLQQRERLLAEIKGEQHELDRQLDQLQESSATVGDIFSTLDNELRQTADQLWQQQRDLNLRLKGNLHWPVNGRVVTGFGTKYDKRTGLSSKSNGINISTTPNRPVIAALTGRVLYIGFARGLENFLVVDHGGSIYSLYGNLSDLQVTEGESVIRGEAFARTAGDRLHFEIRDGKTPVDPLPWLR